MRLILITLTSGAHQKWTVVKLRLKTNQKYVSQQKLIISLLHRSMTYELDLFDRMERSDS